MTATLWYAPIVAYLMLASAWAPRSPFLWAVLPPVALVVMEGVLFRTDYVGDFIGAGCSASHACWTRRTQAPTRRRQRKYATRSPELQTSIWSAACSSSSGSAGIVVRRARRGADARGRHVGAPLSRRDELNRWQLRSAPQSHSRCSLPAFRPWRRPRRRPAPGSSSPSPTPGSRCATSSATCASSAARHRASTSLRRRPSRHLRRPRPIA